MPEQLAFTLLEVKEPWYYQKSRVNADNAETYEKHIESPEGIAQLELVAKTLENAPDGLTDKEIWRLTGIFPSTVSARRNDILKGKYKNYTVLPLIVDGKPFKRDGGQVNCLKRKMF